MQSCLALETYGSWSATSTKALHKILGFLCQVNLDPATETCLGQGPWRKLLLAALALKSSIGCM